MLSDAAKEKIRELMGMYPDFRSALLPALYVAQEEIGWIPDEAIDDIAGVMGLAPTYVAEVASFYTMFHRKPVGKHLIQMCTGVPCKLRGAEELAKHLQSRLGISFGETTPDGLVTLEEPSGCLGACGYGPVMSIDGKYFERLTKERVDEILDMLMAETLDTSDLAPDPQSPQEFGGMEPKVLLANVGVPLSHTLKVYEERGGYQAMRKAFDMKPEEVTQMVKDSGLRGRGGAGFPTGVKWNFLPKGVYPRYLVVNADEGEPGTFKDRMLMEHDPHQLIEGIIISSYAIEAHYAFIYIRGEYMFAYDRLVNAVKEAKEAGYLGKDILGTGFDLEIIVHRGAGAYICGEETALLSSLEGKRGHPKLKPPFPASEGLYRKPTIINNVETICNVPHIVKNGVDWYRSFGSEQSPGMRIFSLSGSVKKPGLYELPHGITLRELIYDYGGGTLDDQPPKGVIPGGISMPILTGDQLDVPLTYEDVQKAGSMLGSSAVIVIGQSESIIGVYRRAIEFYKHESCGKCTPCREGTRWLEDIMHRIEAGKGRLEDIDLIVNIANNVTGHTFCPLGDAAVWGVRSSVWKMRDEYVEYIKKTNPENKGPEEPIWASYRYGAK